MDNCLLVGASGGIGHALLLRLLDDPEIGHIEATGRTGLPPAAQSAGAHWQALDLASDDSIQGNRLRWLESLDHLDYLVFATGMLQDEQQRPEKRLAALDGNNAQRSLRVNCIGPLLLLAALEPLLKKAASPKVIFLSAQVGSIEDNELGGWYSYRMAKAALNMGIKSAAIEFSRWRNDPVIMAVHPGTTHSSLSAPFTRNRKQRVRPATETAGNIHHLMKSAHSAHHGGFFTAEGAPLPW